MYRNIESIKNVIRDIPTNLFLKDTECRYVFSEHYWDHLEHDESENWSIYGKTDLDIRKDKENARFAYEQDKMIIETGKGCRYVIEEKYDDKTDYLEIIKNPVRNENGEIIGIVGLINNITDIYFEEMNNVNSGGENDFMTGLYNKIGFLNHIDNIVDASNISKKTPYVIMIGCVFPENAEECKADCMVLASNTIRLPMSDDKICARIAGEVFAIAKCFDSWEDVEKYVEDIEKRIQTLLSAFYSQDIMYVCEWEKINYNISQVFEELYNTVAIKSKMLTVDTPEIK